MSLLLEALKKAEKAKEEAQRRAAGSDAPAPAAPAQELQLQLEQPAGEPKQVVTRSQLPDISPGLQILSDDLAPNRSDAGDAGGRARSAATPPASAGASARSSSPEGAQASAQRATARKVFEAKFKESNPRMPFYIVMALLGAFALGTVGYFWYQLRPPPPLANANPKPPAEEKSLPTPIAQPPARATAAAPAPAIAGLPPSPAPAPAPAGAAPRAAPPPASRSPLAQAEKPAAPAPAPLVRPSRAEPREEAPRAAASREPRRSETTVSRPVQQVHPKVQSAYAAYVAGDIATARADYQQALREDPSNRDALLGLAAADVRSGRFEAAEAAYVRLLQIDPRDAHAQAGLLALRSGRVDPVAAESRVKSLLASDPGAHVLYFTLGNQLAQQERWAEAQQQYFKAFAAEPDNADFAYNLAVSLDHLRQPRLAREYYQRALALASKGGASFDSAAARQRVEQLGR